MALVSGPLSPEEFRIQAKQISDWIADYLSTAAQRPVLPRVEPGQLASVLPKAAPEEPEAFERIFEDFQSLILSSVTHWNHPRFLAYFAISGSPPGILGEMLAAALNVNAMLWKSCPAATELEQVTLRWLAQWLGLPAGWFGLIYDTASVSSLHALIAARHQAFPEARHVGNIPGLVMYCSEQAHSSIEKAAIGAGIGLDNVRKIEVDERFRMSPNALAASIDEDLRAGKRPFCVVATVGTTATAAIDPVPEIASLCRRHGIWLHVDAAYGGAAAVLPEMRHVLEGCHEADSFVVNPHKWLLTPVDLSAFYTSRPELLRGALSLVPEYLRTEENPRAVNLMDYGVPLGRRFRALKLWFVMRSLGRRGIQTLIRNHIELAKEFAEWVRADDRFEVCAPVDFSLVCFRLRASDEANQALLEAINSSGLAFLSHASVKGRLVLRLAVGNYQTTRQDVEKVWSLIRNFAGAESVRQS